MAPRSIRKAAAEGIARALGPHACALALAGASVSRPGCCWAFALAALGRARLDPGAELALRAALGDCGVAGSELLAARLKAFPGELDPWTVLGIAPGALRAQVKRAYRRLSRLLHPDASPGDDGERFRELRAAYAQLSSRAIG